ncbi:MAG: HAMP domain-containing sensor histidine kinase [Clostridia bacterium]|nr:HAMP domain-containing sensor histidine kinase [Clostridia bacterium]
MAIITRWNKIKELTGKVPIKKLAKNVYKKAHTIRFSMICAYVAVTLITLFLMCVYNIGVLSENLYSEKEMKLYAKANMVSQTVSAVWDANDDRVMYLRIEDITDRLLAGTNIRSVVTDNSYTVLYDNNREANMTGKVFMREVLKCALDGEQKTSTFESDNGKTLTVSVPIELGGEIIGGVYLAENVSAISKSIDAIRTSLVLFSILLLFIIIIITVMISYVVTKPLGEFINVAKAVSKGDFSRRVTVKGSHEMEQMGQAFNFMCDELTELDEKRKNFVSDVSHELKTPMAGIKLLCDSLIAAENPDMDTIREFLNDMSEEIDRLTRLINKLLTLTKLDSGTNLNLSKVEINALAMGVLHSLQKLADEKDIALLPDLKDEPIMINADYDKIYECVYNLVVNAIKYTPEGGHVAVRVNLEGSDCIIEVEDDGPGIPDSEKPKVFERFYRLDDSRARDTGGTGLGLAITKEAVLLHKGSIEVLDAEPNGSIFRITVPSSL